MVPLLFTISIISVGIQTIYLITAYRYGKNTNHWFFSGWIFISVAVLLKTTEKTGLLGVTTSFFEPVFIGAILEYLCLTIAISKQILNTKEYQENIKTALAGMVPANTMEQLITSPNWS